LHTVNTSAGAATIGAFIQNSSLTAGTEVRLGFAPNTNVVSDNRYSWIGAVNTGGSNDSSLTFATTPGGTPATERLRIDSSGQLIVAAKANGTTNGIIYNVPYTGGQANAVSQVLAADTGTANALARINMSTVDLSLVNGSFISFATSPGGVGSPVGDLTTERMRIDSSGRVGIGTSSPAAKLTVYGDGTSADTIDVVNPSATNGATIRFADVNSSSAIKTIPASGTHSLGFFVANSTVERLRIDSSGRVGIGTSTPSHPLTVFDANIVADYVAACFTSTAVGTGESRTWVSVNKGGIGANYGGAIGGYLSQGVGGGLLFGTQNANATPVERARIDSAGRFLVGTSTARSLYGQTGVLQTEGTGYASSGVNIILNNASTAGPLLMLGKSRGSVNGSSTIVQNGDTLGEIYFCGADGTDLDTPGASIRAVVDGAPGSNDIPGRLEFSTTADGAAVPTERMRIDSAGAISSTTAGGGFRIAESNDAVWRRALSQGALVNWTNHIFFRQSSTTANRGIKFSTYDGTGTENVMFELFNGGAALFPSISTTASAANAFLDSGTSNSLLRSTSSLRYKTNIEDLEEGRANAIFNLRPVWYKSLANADRSDWSWYGLIAEEVAEIEPRLVHWTYLEDAFDIKYQTIENEDGTTSQVETERTLKPEARQVPDGVQYDRLTVLLLDVVKRQQQAIETLEAKVAALEAA
jgi:hypothetical protein